MAGYSGTPLAKKLGLKPGHRLFVIGAPEDYEHLLAPLPADVAIGSKPPRGGADIVHLFAPSLAAFETGLPRARKAMKIDGAVWVSWYKKSSGIETDLTEDVIRARMLAGDLVDVKVCAVSEAWSGLKAVVRKALRRP